MLGALLAIPVAAAVQIVVRELWQVRQERNAVKLTDPGAPPPSILDPMT